MTPLEKKEQLIQMFGIYTKRLEKLYDKFYSSLASLGYTDEVLMGDALFNFDSMPEMTAEVNNIFEDFVQKQMLAYRAGITDGIGLAFLHDNTTLQGASVLSDIAVNQVRETAVQTFLRTRLHVPKGLNLSQLVWNYASQAKSEFEVAMSDVIADGLKTGTSAEELGRKVRSYLKHPDMMYRRYHEKVVMSDGTKKDVVIWRRRVVDEDGKVRFVKEPLEAVGRGHYRSARKNAYRLMRSEINMAYHNANHDRWLQEPFVIGQRIWLSPQHPHYDICDELAGDYPKEFLFIGWHPQCMCSSAPITLKGEERKEYYRRLAAGEDMSNYVSPNAIKDVPQGYKDYVVQHADEIIRADRRGKLPWHFDANREYWEDLASEAMKKASQPVLKTLEHVDEVVAKFLEDNKDRLEHIGKEDVEQAKQFLREMLDESDYGMQVPRMSKNGDDVIDAIFSSGVFKNQFETSTGQGAINPEYRKSICQELFGADVDKMQPQDFEKYGMLFHRDILMQASSGIGGGYWNFGDGMQVRFRKDKVKTTFCLQDSFFTERVSRTDSVQLSCGSGYGLRSTTEMAKSYVDSGLADKLSHVEGSIGDYVELQYHGPLTTDCIESVFLPQQTLRQLKSETFDKIKKVGCTIYTTDADGKLITI